jgi:hypothetical protein
MTKPPMIGTRELSAIDVVQTISNNSQSGQYNIVPSDDTTRGFEIEGIFETTCDFDTVRNFAAVRQF